MTTLAPFDFVMKNIVKSDKYKFMKKGEYNRGVISCLVNVDSDNWEAFAPGYEHDLSMKRKYKIKKIIGVYEQENGKHKIAVKLYAHGFDDNLAMKHIDKFRKVRKKNEKGTWVCPMKLP